MHHHEVAQAEVESVTGKHGNHEFQVVCREVRTVMEMVMVWSSIADTTAHEIGSITSTPSHLRPPP